MNSESESPMDFMEQQRNEKSSLYAMYVLC